MFYRTTIHLTSLTICFDSKQNSSFKNKIVFVFFVLCFTSCISNKIIPKDQHLYGGAKLKIDSRNKIGNDLKDELSLMVFPKENSSFLGLRPKLWLYYQAIDMKDNRWSKWLKNKLGEPPVLMDQVDPEKVSRRLKNKLNNRGYFSSRVDYELQIKKKVVKVIYNVEPVNPYIINDVYFPVIGNVLENNILSVKNKTLLIKGKQFDIDLLKEESDRIELSLKNEGFFYFQSALLKYKIDSTIQNNKLNIYLDLISNIPENAKLKYTIRNVYVDASFELGNDAETTVSYLPMDKSGYFYQDKNNQFKPTFILKAINLKPNEIYQKQKHDITLSHLTGLGTFKFVNLRFEEIKKDSSDLNGTLDLYIYLTPFKKNTIRLELNAVSKTNNFAGPGFDLSYKNKNSFKGAEFYTLKLTTGFETQITSYQRGLNSFLLGIDNEVYFPRFFSPVRLPNVSEKFIPRTKIKLGYQLLDRINFYRLTSINTTYGFNWNESINKIHELNPIAINYIDLSRQSNSFKSLLESNSILKKSFENQFISGGIYNYIYSNQIDDRFKNHTYFNGNLDLSGNIFYLMESLFQKSRDIKIQPYTIFNLAYSQYARIELDYRHFPVINNKSKLALRSVFGFGIAYGNSSNLPYIKQFYIGGTNSIRAFLPRSIGPGSVFPKSKGSANLFIDQTGDIKMETNLEYRFDLSRLFKGAFFLDAGNIWQFNRTGISPGAGFQFNNFYKNIAIGTGSGLRLDFSYFLIRFDWAFPLRIPYLPEDEKWVIRKIHLFNSSWRKENMVLNIAIGYPF